MSDYKIDWSHTNIDGNNTVSGPDGHVGFTVSTPENQDHDQWMKGTVDGYDGLKAWDVNDPTKVKIVWDAPVENVSFNLIDVDSDHNFDDRITVIAKDIHGNILPVTFTGTNHQQHVTGNQLDAFGHKIGAHDAGHVVGVHVQGEVASLEVVYDNGAGAHISGTVGLGDIHFDAVADDLDGYVEGTSGDDVIDVAYAGDEDGDKIDNGDAILPGEGAQDDIVIAGAGNDIVESGEGNDDVYGGKGNDDIDAGAGDDLVFGGGGSDSIVGGAGNDTLIGGGQSFDGTQDFNDLATGELVNGQYIADGVTITSANDATPVMIFDSANPTGGDHDLATHNLGNVLILSEDGDSSDPDDNAHGGTFIINFDNPASVSALTLLDVEEGAWIKYYDANGTKVHQVDVATANNGQHVVNTDLTNIMKIEVILAGSGAIDNLSYAINPDSMDGADVISGGAGDDIIEGNAGNDDLSGDAGADFIKGGAGDDVIDGGAEDDIIKGDNGVAGGAGAPAEFTIDWDQLGSDGSQTLTSDGQSVGVSINTPQNAEHKQWFVENGMLKNWDVTSPSSADLSFDTDVSNVQFTLLDVDGLDKITIMAKDANGDLVAVDFEDTGVHTVTGTMVVGSQTNADGPGAANNGQDIDVTINGPITDLWIILDDGPERDYSGTVAVSDITFEVPAVGSDDGDDTIHGGDGNDDIMGEGGDDLISGDAGDDVITGDDGDDTIFGGSGDDVITTGAGADTVDAGADADVIFGSAGDFVDGGAGGNDNDVLDLTGQGPFFVDNVSTDSNGNGIDGTVVFVDADGNPTGETITFVEIEEIIGDQINRGPEASDDTGATDEDTAIALANVLGNDTDADGDDLVVTKVDGLLGNVGDAVEASNGGLITINADGSASFDPNGEFDGLAVGETAQTSVTYMISDGNGGTSMATVTVTVTGTNDAPVANNDSTTTDEDEAVVVDLLANDTDVDGDDLTVTNVSVPADQGTVVDNGDGTVTFTPAPDFNGTATISYDITDGNGGTDSAQHFVEVEGVNDGPVANDDAGATDQDTAIALSNVLGNDTDLEGDDLVVTKVDGMTGKVGDAVEASNGGLITINADGSASFDPNGEFDGLATGETAVTSVTYMISDGNGGTSMATVNVTVTGTNDAPVANNDSDVTDFNTAVVVDLLANDFDVDGDDLTVTSLSVPADQGTIVDNGDGTATFTPATGFVGAATITYHIQDEEGLTADAIHTVVVDAGLLDGTVSGTDGDDKIDGDYLGDPEGDLVDNNDAIIGNAGSNDDIIEGNGGNDMIDAGTGDDTVFGGDGDDMVMGGEGDDTIFGDDGDDVLEGNDGEDFISGGDGNDDIWGGDDDDELQGNAGNDTVGGGDGEDIVRGGQGEDTLFGGNDDDMLFGGADDDTISGDSGDDKVEGGSGDDTIFGGQGNDDLWGASGDDEVFGGTGDDTIATADGNDVVEGGDGNDTIDTSGHAPLPDLSYGDIIPADGGTFTLPDGTIITTSPTDDLDTVFGGAGNDTITTGDDADYIEGGSGADVIDGGIDDDEIFGGDGDDLIVGGEGNDVIEGGDGNDTIFAGVAPGETVIPDIPGAPFIPEQIEDAFDPEPDNGDDLVFGGAGNDTIFGADDSDELSGGEGNDVVYGEVDDDVLFGDAGDDELFGGQGEDFLFGGEGDDTLTGGEGPDVQLGEEGSDTFIVDQAGDGADDVIVGGEDADGLDIDVLDLTGSNVDFITYEDDDPEAGVVTFQDGSTLTFSEIENVVPCFTPGTTIATPKGERLVEELREGDRIITRDNGIQEIRWVGRKEMTGKALVSNPHLKPILIRAGSLGNGLPERDMLVSPNHRMLVASDKTQLYFEEREVLAAAKHLVGAEGIHSVDVMGTAYIHFMFDRHEVVLSNGAWTESFQPGDYSLKGIGNGQRNEIFELFPELASKTGLESYQSARRALKKHEARLLVK